MENHKNFIQLEKEELKQLPKKEFEQFVKFAFKGKMLELAVAFILGAAFQKTVEAISSCIIMPLVNFFISHTGSNWRLLAWTPTPGMTFELGKFLGSFVDFVVLAVLLYILYYKIAKPIFEQEDKATKSCPECQSDINVNAKKCPFCTSLIEESNESE